jgi:hypothetical protein
VGKRLILTRIRAEAVERRKERAAGSMGSFPFWDSGRVVGRQAVYIPGSFSYKTANKGLIVSRVKKNEKECGSN